MYGTSISVLNYLANLQVVVETLPMSGIVERDLDIIEGKRGFCAKKIEIVNSLWSSSNCVALLEKSSIV